MPRNYKRKAPDRHTVTDDQLETAKLLISKGASKRNAACQVGLKESTLRKRLKIGKTSHSLGRFSTTFTKVQEDDIYKYIKESDDLFYGLTIHNLQKLIYEYAVINTIPHRFNTTLKLAGRDWVYGFLKRFPDLKLRQPTSITIAKTMGFNIIQFFFENLQRLHNKYQFAPSRIYNMDESGVNTLPEKNTKVISDECGQIIKLLCAMSATGKFDPPAFIFSRERIKGNLLNNVPIGSVGMVSDSGSINSDLFLEYLRHFHDNVQPTQDNPILLVLDKLSKHVSSAAVNFCTDNNIHMLTLPPHNTHKMQPLDRGFFGHFKMEFAYECDKWVSHHPGRVIGQREIAQLVNEAFKKAATVNNAISGFKFSGIWPINSIIFLEEDFAESSDTNVILVPNTQLLQKPMKAVAT